jgi:hypothetical protein
MRWKAMRCRLFYLLIALAESGALDPKALVP